MVKKKFNSKMITFSVDDSSLTFRDSVATGKLAEKYFNMQEDKNQIPATKETINYIIKNIPDCDNTIKENGKIIGFTFIIPCNKKLMNLFLKNKLNERELFEKIKEYVNYDNFETIYICSIFVKPQYRGLNLSSIGLIKSIKKIIRKRKLIPILFCEPYTLEGKIVCEKVAKKLGFKLKQKILKKH